MAREAGAHKKILESTRSIMFMGVPHDGADAAKLASRIGDVAKVFCNLNLINLKDLERDSRSLQEISQSFSFLNDFDIITVMESERTVIPGTTTSILVSAPRSVHLGLPCCCSLTYGRLFPQHLHGSTSETGRDGFILLVPITGGFANLQQRLMQDI